MRDDPFGQPQHVSIPSINKQYALSSGTNKLFFPPQRSADLRWPTRSVRHSSTHKIEKKKKNETNNNSNKRKNTKQITWLFFIIIQSNGKFSDPH